MSPHRFPEIGIPAGGKDSSRGVDTYRLLLYLPRLKFLTSGATDRIMKTTFLKECDVVRDWYVFDATDKPAGRLAVEIANVLRGKHKPAFAPHTDTGDHVIVVNAECVKLTGSKEEKKIYKNYSGYPSGLKEYKASMIREKNPTRIVSQAVRGMLPKTRQGRKVFRRLHVYTGTEHPHEAQKPTAR
jgi:large subunit ribosomal protein L13